MYTPTLRALGLLGALLAVTVIAGACGNSPDDTNATPTGETGPPASTGGTDQATPVPTNDQDDRTSADPSASGPTRAGSGGDQGNVNALLAGVEADATPLGDITGVDRPGGLEPTLRRVESYPRLCPAEDLPVAGVLQEDPLVENLPVQRYILAFASEGDAQAFFDDLASTEVGCIATRETQVSIGTTTIETVEPLTTADGTLGVEIDASVAVDLTNIDRDPPGANVTRSVVIDGNAVIIVVSLTDYGSFVGADNIHQTLLADGIELVRAGL
jgi:hypothetical protein